MSNFKQRVCPKKKKTFLYWPFLFSSSFLISSRWYSLLALFTSPLFPMIFLCSSTACPAADRPTKPAQLRPTLSVRRRVLFVDFIDAEKGLSNGTNRNPFQVRFDFPPKFIYPDRNPCEILSIEDGYDARLCVRVKFWRWWWLWV